MTSGPHDELRDALPEYALGGLEPADRARVHAHVVGCAPCQAELAELRTALAGVGTATAAEPPPSLRARVLQQATAPGRGDISSPPASSSVSRERGWMPLALAASIVFGVLAAGYAWSLRVESASARQQVSDAADYVTTLREELVATRRDAAELARVLQILGSPNLLRVDLAAQSPGASATARAFWSASNGLLFSARGMPALDAGRVYQLWTIRGTTATSAGTMTPDAAGTIVYATATSGEPPEAVGVTIEPAGGSESPTLPVMMIGRASGR